MKFELMHLLLPYQHSDQIFELDAPLALKKKTKAKPNDLEL
jgi:hypothetical protein